MIETLIETFIETLNYAHASHPFNNLLAWMVADITPVLTDATAAVYFMICLMILPFLCIWGVYFFNDLQNRKATPNNTAQQINDNMEIIHDDTGKHIRVGDHVTWGTVMLKDDYWGDGKREITGITIRRPKTHD